MNVDTGQTITLEEWERMTRRPGFDPEPWVRIEGDPDAIDRLSDRVARTRESAVKAKARRQKQKASRRRNR